MCAAKIEIREMCPDDHEGVKNTAAEAHAFLRRFYRRIPTAVRSGEDVPFTRLALVLDGNVVGTATYEVRGNSLYFGSLSVLENFRRKGVTRQLISFLESKAKGLGLSSISCETVLETGNPSIFQRLGFSAMPAEISVEFESPHGEGGHEVLMVKPVAGEQ